MLEYSRGIYYINGVPYKGCQCKSFLVENEQNVSFAEILSRYNFIVPMKMGARDYFSKTVDILTSATKIAREKIVLHILQILTFDFIICNPDRHLNNIEFVYNSETQKFRFAPIYDHGQSFLYSNSQLSEEQYVTRIHKFKTKPFSSNPKSNLIYLDWAKRITESFLETAGGYKGIADLSMNSYHNWLVRKRIQMLLEDM